MSKFKVGDRVRLTHDCRADCRDGETQPEYGRAGQCGVVVDGTLEGQRRVSGVGDGLCPYWQRESDLELATTRLADADLSAYTSHTSAEMVEWCGVGRGVVRGKWGICGSVQIVAPEFAGEENRHVPACRCAVNYVDDLWSAYKPNDVNLEVQGLTELQAIAWVLDGVLPTS